jgi:hypothetical protein
MKRIYAVFAVLILGMVTTTARAQTNLQALPVATAAKSYTVNLTWQNGCASGITCTFDAYACTGTAAACPTNGSQQLWLKLNSSPITALLYQDSRPTVLLPGVTVSYVVYANASGQTAGPSNEFTLPLPLAPVAPSSLAATATAQ